MHKTIYVCALLISALSVSNLSAQMNWDGSIELEHRYFWDNDSITNLDNNQTSVRLEMEFFKAWNNGDDQVIFEPFIRYDNQDDERSHADARQLIWTRYGSNWELSAGLGRVFWGVTESQHLVDIINQTDSVENIDGEDKLGQPMIRYQYFNKYGNFDAFVLPYFRTRTFVGADSRLSGGIIVSNDDAAYESDREESHIDYAFRYSNTIGDLSLGLSVFDGTSREADILRLIDPVTFNSTPYYPQITQFATDLQLTTNGWLFKLEAIQRNFDDSVYEDYNATTLGTEYTFVGVFDSIYDIGALAEYSWDEREELATSPFQNDLFIGARFVFNDFNNSEILAGISSDLDYSNSQSFFLEASTRFATSFTANLEIRYFDSDEPSDLIYNFRDHSFIQLGIEYFFD